MTLAPGVYFGLPEAEYFADDAIGSTDLKELARSPADWWWNSAHNPLRQPPADNDGKRFGSALHTALLEGMDVYEARYFIRPEAPEKCVRTMDDMRALLDYVGVAYKKSLKKDELTDLFLSHHPEHVVYDRWIVEQTQQFAGMVEISERWDQAIRLMAQVIRSHPQLKDAFVGGMPEVSVIYMRDGVKRRARFDYLKPQGLFDLKSISNWRGDDFRKACLKQIASFSYDVQAADYIDAHAEMLSLLREGRIFGEVDPAFPKEVLKASEFLFVFVFMQTIGSPRALPVVFPQGNIVHETGQRVKQAALENYRTYRDRFGLENMWVEVDELWNPALDDWAVTNMWR